MIVSYCPKPNKNVLLVSTVHGEPDICDASHKKSIAIDFYNIQRCAGDVTNQMLRDHSEAATQRCSEEKVFWKYAGNLQENTHAEVRF